MGPGDIRFSAQERADLLSWASMRFGSVESVSLDTDPARCLALVVDVGSGAPLQMALIYVQLRDADAQWSLIGIVRTEQPRLLIRAEGKHAVTVSTTDGSLVARFNLAQILRQENRE